MWAKYPMTLKWDYILIAKTINLETNVKIKVEIYLDQNEIINYGEVFVYNDNLMKFNKLIRFNLDGLFGAESAPEGEMDDGLPKKINEAADRLINIAVNILR
ncbi:hypothetical protein ES703_65625 [subsurface metagenome]